MTLPEFDPATVPAAEIPAALTALAAWQSALAARLMTVPQDDAATGQLEECDKLLTVKEAAERLRHSRKWIYRAVEKGSLPFARRIGNALMFSESGLEKWVTRQRV